MSPRAERIARLARAAGPGLVAFAVGVAWFFRLGLGEAASPFHLRWAFDEDWSVGPMAFLQYRNAPWGFPIGFTPNYAEPDGTTLGYTDGLPGIAPLFKALSPILPFHFQYIGPYWALAYGLLGLVGERFTARLTRDPIQRALGGALLALTPILAARSGHPTLCALFLPATPIVLAARRPATFAVARRHLVGLVAVTAIAAGGHPYLAAMTTALAVAAAATHARSPAVPRPYAPLWILAPLAVAGLSAWLYGYVGWREMERSGDGFGEFSADLLTLVNPAGRSRFFAALPMQPRQMEGFGYLGAGTLALLAVRGGFTVVAALRRAPRRTGAVLRRTLLRGAPIALVALGFAVFALSWSVRARGVQIADLRPLYAPVWAAASTYRASGRFIWPLHLTLAFAAIAVVARLRRRPWLARGLLAGAVIAQAAEAPDLGRVPRRDAFAAYPPDRFAGVEGDYDRFVFVPIHLQWICRYDEGKVHRFVYEAARRRMGINAAYLPRAPRGIRERCDKHLPRTEPLDPRAIYVVDDDFAQDFARPDAICAIRDRVRLCVATRETAFAQRLRSE